MFSLGLSLQWWFSLRAVDVRGQWLETSETDGPLVRKGRRWQDELTWNMIDRDVSLITKQISKNGIALGEPLEFNIVEISGLQERFLTIPADQRTGPIITTKAHGLPWDVSAWRTILAVLASLTAYG